ncbi:MAG: ABC transporter ATP-binding protein [Lachnospiraceae bacterium]|nr:ABC transporter ATP-binding protein [Lachnospiraceae bacterium]
MEASLFTIKHLNAWYSRERMVLSDVSLELKEREVVGLIGLNGAGKTTFLKVLSGLFSNFHSKGIWFSNRLVNLRGEDFKICRYTVFDEDHSFQYFTFQEYLTYVFSAYGKELPDLSELIKGFHFEENRDILLKDLSTGSRKKVFLITAFALKPRLLFLDEPVNGLDFESTEYLYQQVAEYKKYGTILFSSHILESITLTSDRVLVLEKGTVQKRFEKGEIHAADIREALHYENTI